MHCVTYLTPFNVILDTIVTSLIYPLRNKILQKVSGSVNKQKEPVASQKNLNRGYPEITTESLILFYQINSN